MECPLERTHIAYFHHTAANLFVQVLPSIYLNIVKSVRGGCLSPEAVDWLYAGSVVAGRLETGRGTNCDALLRRPVHRGVGYLG